MICITPGNHFSTTPLPRKMAEKSKLRSEEQALPGRPCRALALHLHLFFKDGLQIASVLRVTLPTKPKKIPITTCDATLLLQEIPFACASPWMVCSVLSASPLLHLWPCFDAFSGMSMPLQLALLEQRSRAHCHF